jgi:hypothetical protein
LNQKFELKNKETAVEKGKTKTGEVVTFVDGYDVKQLNLWSSPSDNRSQTGVLKNGDKVEIISEQGEYYFVKAGNTSGYCMKGFIKVDG